MLIQSYDFMIHNDYKLYGSVFKITTKRLYLHYAYFQSIRQGNERKYFLNLMTIVCVCTSHVYGLKDHTDAVGHIGYMFDIHTDAVIMLFEKRFRSDVPELSDPKIIISYKLKKKSTKNSSKNVCVFAYCFIFDDMSIKKKTFGYVCQRNN